MHKILVADITNTVQFLALMHGMTRPQTATCTAELSIVLALVCGQNSKPAAFNVLIA